MRICIVATELAPYGKHGGIGTHVLHLADGLGQRGHAVTVAGYELHPEAPRIRHAWGDSVSLSLLPSIDRTWDRGRIRGAFAVARYIRQTKGRFDVIETSNWGNAAFLPRAGFRYAARLSSSVADYGKPGWGTKFCLRMEARACARADLWLANSDAMHQRARELYGCREVPCQIVPYGVPGIPNTGLKPDDSRLTVVCVGRAEHRKGSDVLIQALSRVMPACPDLQLRLVGSDFDSYVANNPRLQPLWTDLKARCGDRIVERGWLSAPERDREFAEAHWFLITSRFESFGLVVIEAMSAGTPVLAAAGGALPEVCSKGPGNRMYAPPDDPSALAALLEEVAHLGPTYASGLRVETRAAWQRWYTPDSFVERTLACYERLSSIR